MKPIHILNGDCLAEQLNQSNLNKEFIICRECLVEGDVLAENLEDFWRKRSEFISESYHITKEEYQNKTVSDATQKAAFEKFGERGVIDLVGVSGYYTLVSMVLNVDRQPLPAGTPPPLQTLNK